MELKKSLTLIDLILLSLGNIIGAGIFVILAKTLLHKYTLYAFILVAIVSIISGFTYSEISQRYKSNVAESDIIREVYGSKVETISMVLIFLFAIFSSSTIIINLSKYINPKYSLPISILLMTIMGTINYLGIDTSKYVFNTIGIIMLIYLATFIFFGLPTVQFPSLPSIDTLHPLLISSIFAIFLYNGYDATIKVYDEVINPDNIPKAITISLIITTIIYFCVLFITQSNLSLKQLKNTYTPLSDVFEKLIPHSYFITLIIGLFVMFNTAFVSLLCGTRYLYGLGKDQKIPPVFSETNQYKAPHYSILLSCILMFLLIITNNENLALIITNLCVFLILILTNLGLFFIKYNPIQLIPTIVFTILFFYSFYLLIYRKL